MLILCIYLDSTECLASNVNGWGLFPTVRNEKGKTLPKFVVLNEKACAQVLTKLQFKTQERK